MHHSPNRFLAALLALATAVTLAACTQAPLPAADPTPRSDVLVPVSGAIDDRDYRHLRLANGLQVLAVSDPTTDQAAAALAVDVGSFDEDDDRLGLAHFLEHMLFLGTTKYPAPDEYGEFISRHGGERNAYTSLDHTNYFFSISADQLYGGLERFSQFFVAPLFTAEYVEREKNAVDSEYQMQLRDDGWRTYMTQKRAMNPDHPGARFTIGSLDTLADRDGSSVRDELLEFYDTHYSADRMALVVLGREDADQLLAWATELFAEVPTRPTVDEAPAEPMFRHSELPSLMRIQPVKERRTLEFTFALPGADDLYRVSPGGYLANLLGHEGEGSLHARLRELGWIEGLSAGDDTLDAANSQLTVSMSLTEEGLAHWQEAGRLLFDYVALLRAEGIEGWRYREQSRLAQLAFDYREKGDAFGYARSLASNLLEYPAEDVMRGPYAMDRYDADVIARFLDRVRPQLAQVTLIAPGVDTDRVEPWFDVAYAIVPLPADTLAAWQAATPTADAALQLPPPNPFVPEDLSLLADAAATVPTRIIEAPGLHVWHLPDTSFRVPRAQLRIDLRTARAAASPMDAVYARLYSRLVMDALNEYAYPARLAGLSFALGAEGDSLALSLGGFDDKLDELLARVATTARDLEIRDDRLALFREELIRDLRNSRKDRPYQQTMAELRRLLEWHNYPLEALLEAAQAADRAGLEAWIDAALAHPELVALFVGNLDEQRARALARTLEQTLRGDAGAPLAAKPARRLVRLADGDVVQRQVQTDHADSAFTLYVQGDDQSWAERARFGLLAQMLSTPYFNALRTERQLGYVVGAGPWIRLNTPGLYFLVQSPVASPAEVEAATWAFLESYRARLAAMSESEFEAARAGLLSLVLEADKSLGERAGRLWRDLDGGFVDFDSRDRIAAAIGALDLATMRSFYDRFVATARSRRATTWAAGRFPLPEAMPEGTPVPDMEAFKADSDTFTVPAIPGTAATAAGS
ncbi:MAG TPA: insulinase family protein [Pseudomonadales bacterium]|nr:insulinase family protein [Pseudomonadales bacterium]